MLTSHRMTGLDAARAVAIIGMVAVNVGPNGEPGWAGFLYDLPVGRASLLFMLLAGVGMSFLTRSAREPGGRLPWVTVLWRSALLLAGGLALQELGHEVSVILAVYGVVFLLSLPLLRAPTAVLICLAALMTVLGPILWIGIQLANGGAFHFADPSLGTSLPRLIERITLSGSYPLLIWCVPFLAGLVLGRLALSSRAVQHRMLVWGMIAAVGGYGASVLLRLVLGEPDEELGWDRLLSAAGHSEMPLWLISGMGAAVAVMAVFLRAGTLVDRWLGPLVSAGRLSLTLYVAHLLILAALIRPEPDDLASGYVITTLLCLGLIAFAHLWTRWRPIGPLEQLMRLPRRR